MTAINTDYTDMTLTISLGDGQIGLTNKVPEPSINAVTLYFKNEQLISIDQVPGDETVTRVAIITPPTNIETNTIALYIDELAAEAKLKLESSMTGQLTDDQRQSPRHTGMKLYRYSHY